ncbi:hypothetical protein CHARACLAT_025223 [Characodon lateralis]|uniref:Uncharacterized protein n=1 Tax=Characodon lateralis TaxID=208331 RepID=A0ABU7EQC6_9TELE|nr:hypothetical protein [Characodon lateralis]
MDFCFDYCSAHSWHSVDELQELAALQRMFMCYRSAVRQCAAELIYLTGAEERFVRVTAPCWRSDLSEFFRSLIPRSDHTLSKDS